MISMDDLQDITYEVDAGLAWITINRPERYNAFRGRTVDELLAAFKTAWADRAVGVVAFTGAGDKAFCAGGDQKQRAETGDYGPTETGMFEIEAVHRVIRDIPKPVIAAVNGFAIGGGHVLHVSCDITIAAEHARFGQTGPRVGSFDAGFGSAYLARIVGQKRAREIWMFCRQYDAATAERWGLVNAVVPLVELRATVRAWADEALALSPTALKGAEALFQRRDRTHLGHRRNGLRQPGLVPRHRRGGRGCHGLQREAAARLRAVPLNHAPPDLQRVVSHSHGSQ
jgi:2-ketocyclohexanecarboxyl-CoA hydrolase